MDLLSKGEKIELNFGQEPFVFDSSRPDSGTDRIYVKIY